VNLPRTQSGRPKYHAFLVAEAAGKLIRLPTGDGMALAFHEQHRMRLSDAPLQRQSSPELSQ